MNLFNILKITAIGVIDVLIVALLLPTLINAYGTLGLIAVPFVIIIAGWATIQAVKSAIK